MSPESTAPSGQALPAGTRLEEFEIESVLGRGGFGITYLARDTSLGRQVVIKENLPAMFAYRETTSGTVRPQSESGEDADNFRWSMKNFLREADTLASLDHPGIVSVLRKFEANGTAYFVMPHVEGLAFDTLESSRQEKGQWFTEDELRGLLEHVLDALGYLHARGIYHRDIKPGNILITTEGVPILIDFGSARQRLSERSMTVVESAGYTPFEQLESRGNVGPWSDLYALGATVVRVVTGQPLPKAMDRVRSDPYEPLSRRPNLRERYSETLLSSIDRALEVEELARWQDAGQWQRGLSMGERIASGRGGATSPANLKPSSPEVPGGPAGVAVGAVSPGPKGKGKGLLVAVGAAALLGMVGVGVVLTGNMRAEEERVLSAQELLEKDAEQGDAQAQCELGWKYEHGRGVLKDEAEAVKWYRKAAEQGDAYGQSELGWMYEHGRGVLKDEAEAVKWYRKAAEQGDAYGQSELGWMYANGRGVLKDEAEAVKWYRKAAAQGNAYGQNELGVMYETGRGVAKDEAGAVKWYRKAAEQGDADAKAALRRLGVRE